MCLGQWQQATTNVMFVSLHLLASVTGHKLHHPLCQTPPLTQKTSQPDRVTPPPNANVVTSALSIECNHHSETVHNNSMFISPRSLPCQCKESHMSAQYVSMTSVKCLATGASRSRIVTINFELHIFPCSYIVRGSYLSELNLTNIRSEW